MTLSNFAVHLQEIQFFLSALCSEIADRRVTQIHL